MPRFTVLAALCAALNATGCSTRVSHEQAQPSGSSTTVVEVCPLDSPPPAPEPPPDPQPPFIEMEGNVIVFGDVEQHHHLHVHEAPAPPRVRVDVRVEVETIDERDRRRRLVERRLTELLERR